MINTFYGLEKLVTAPTSATFLAALLIGLLFGFALEYAGFSSSRKLAGIFYFRDMTVLRVMFTALITAMLGLSIFIAVGWIDLDSQIYVLPTVYGAQIVGGLIFGVGFALSGWCPGTGLVGVAAGKLDALVFLVGVTFGAVLFNETYPWVKGLQASSGVQVAFGMGRNVFALLFTLAAVAAFYFSEWIERKVAGGGRFLHSTMLRTLSVCLVIVAVIVFVIPPQSGTTAVALSRDHVERSLLADIGSERDHIDPEELADALMQGDYAALVIDVRPADEFAGFHIAGAVNVQLPGLIDYVKASGHAGPVVLYSNGMIHAAQGRDALARIGYENVFMLTDGLQGFRQRCLKPVSLRAGPLAAAEADRVRAWRSFFLAEQGVLDGAGSAKVAAKPTGSSQDESIVYTENDAPRLVATSWLDDHLQDSDLRIIDCRTHADYTEGHIPGAVYLNLESVRGDVGGVPSVLLPGAMLAAHLSLLGVQPTDMIVFDPGTGVRDATLISMALERVGHERWGILHGGFPKWQAENRAVEQVFPSIAATDYPLPASLIDVFTVNAEFITDRLQDGKTVLVDTRPRENYTGEKSREMKSGHIPGAINRVYKEDLDAAGNLKSVAELAAAYEKIVPSKETPVVVYCRTGHQASLTFFVLKEVLGYKDVKWYDGSWSDWAARDLPAEK